MPNQSIFLVAWNSQGAKWGSYYTNCIKPIVDLRQGPVVGGLVEAGWAPWVRSQEVHENALYPNRAKDVVWKDDTVADAFHQALVEGQGSATWIPWVKTPADMTAHTNSRCSLSNSWFPLARSGITLGHADRFSVPWMLRPAARMVLSKGRVTVLTVLIVHFVSSSGAAAELLWLTQAARQFIDANAPAVIMGDINVNLLVHPNPVLAPKWRIVAINPRVATQRSGGLLDYAILYDPFQQVGSEAQVLWEFSPAADPQGQRSDHSAIGYKLTSAAF